MQINRKTLALLAVAALVALAFLALSRKRPQPQQSHVQHSAQSTPEHASPNPTSNMMAVARDFTRNYGVRKTILTPEEKAALETRFTLAIKPAVDQWCRAYAGHLPFNPSDLTFDKFKEKIGRNDSFTIYTFMIDGITFCVRESKGTLAVNYLFAPQARQLSQLPEGALPTLQHSITRETIIRMVRDDSGTEFSAHQVTLRPTGISSGLNGGTTVDIAPLGGDPNNGLSKLCLVFGPSGELIYYDRDPTF